MSSKQRSGLCQKDHEKIHVRQIPVKPILSQNELLHLVLIKTVCKYCKIL